MSHWQAGKLSLKCSLSVLQRALIKIMPQWKDHIKADPGGKLVVQDMSGRTQSGYHLMVPKTAPGSSYCDLGFKKEADGTWSILSDPGGLPRQISNPGDTMKDTVGKMQAIAIAKLRGFTIVRDEGDELDLIIPVGEEFKLRA